VLWFEADHADGDVRRPFRYYFRAPAKVVQGAQATWLLIMGVQKFQAFFRTLFPWDKQGLDGAAVRLGPEYYICSGGAEILERQSPSPLVLICRRDRGAKLGLVAVRWCFAGSAWFKCSPRRRSASGRYFMLHKTKENRHSAKPMPITRGGQAWSPKPARYSLHFHTPGNRADGHQPRGHNTGQSTMPGPAQKNKPKAIPLMQRREEITLA